MPQSCMWGFGAVHRQSQQQHTLATHICVELIFSFTISMAYIQHQQLNLINFSLKGFF